MFVLKFEQIQTLFIKTVGAVANSVDPDQAPHFAASNLGAYCSGGLSIRIFRLLMVVVVQTSLCVSKEIKDSVYFDAHLKGK